MSRIKKIGKPSMVDILDLHAGDIKATLNAVNIGQITAFNASEQTADVQLLIKMVQEVSPDGVPTYAERPALIRVPCITLFGGNAFLSMPIQVGDSCLVFFNDRETDGWMFNGGVQAPVSHRLHDASDAFALVGVRSLVDVIATYLSNGIRLSYGDNGTSQIDLQTAAINTLAALFTHTGNMKITGTLEVEGNVKCDANLVVTGTMSGNGGTLTSTDGIAAPTLSAANGATGTGTHVTVVKGIVTVVT